MISPYAPIQSARLYKQVAEQIKDRILSGQLQHGDKLPVESELAKIFGVSRIVIREAMKELAQTGLIEIRPGRGTFVVDDTSRVAQHSLDMAMQMSQAISIAQVTDIRAILEPEIAYRAALNANADDLQSISASIEKMDTLLNDSPEFLRLDREFHIGLANATHNSLILLLLSPVLGFMQGQQVPTDAFGMTPQEAQEHHKHILAAVLAHDPEEARRAMRHHLQRVKENEKNPA